jgi:hypothetical protein
LLIVLANVKIDLVNVKIDLVREFKSGGLIRGRSPMGTAKNRGLSPMSGLWTSAFESAGSHLSAGWFWLFPLLFAIHDAEEAAYVWKEGSLHNSISYTTLNVTQTLVAISFELTIFMAAAAWATQPGASHLAIFTFAVLLGGYTAHAFFNHLYLGWRAHEYTLGVATALPLVVFGGLFIYAKLIETGTLSWTLAAASFVLGTLVMLPLIWGARRVGLTFA